MWRRHRIELKVTADTPANAAPAATAFRLIALLPAEWDVALQDCSTSTATLVAAAPAHQEPTEVAQAIGEALRHSAFQGWAVRAREIR